MESLGAKALKPRATDTDLFRRAEMEDTEVGSSGKESNDPAEVAKQDFDALMKGEQEVFAASLSTKAGGVMGLFMSDSGRPGCTRRWPGMDLQNKNSS